MVDKKRNEDEFALEFETSQTSEPSNLQNVKERGDVGWGWRVRIDEMR